MKLGLGPIPADSTTTALLRELAAAAAGSSFDSVWVSEAREARAGAGLALAAHLAQLTPLRTGAVVDLGLYHPLHLAEDIAIADVASRGRVEVVLRRPRSEVAARYGATASWEAFTEQVEVLAAALTGAHLQWNGQALRIPGRLAENQPAPERLALNPRPAQPWVPLWLAADDAGAEELARGAGLGLAASWTGPGCALPPATVRRLPSILFCQEDVDAADLLAAAGERAGYFLVAAPTPESAIAAGRRLAGPLRMPNFPAWINAQIVN